VRFLVDAPLPRRLAHRLRDAGHGALHTLDLPAGNRTTDEEIIELSVRVQRVVMEALLSANLERLIEALQSADYVEMGRSAITVHA
jgi:predicted nuclease of predicted toxin-antitoxin system